MPDSSKKIRAIHIWKAKKWLETKEIGCPFGSSNPCYICRVLFPEILKTKPILPDMTHRCAGNVVEEKKFEEGIRKLIKKYEERKEEKND